MVTDSANDFEAGIRFRFPRKGTGLGPGGKFFGRKLAQEYGAIAMMNAARIPTPDDTSNKQSFVVQASSSLPNVSAMIENQRLVLPEV